MSKRGRQAGGETCRSADKQAERQEGRQAGGKGGRKESWWAGGRAGAGRQASRHNLQGLLLQLLLLLGIRHLLGKELPQLGIVLRQTAGKERGRGDSNVVVQYTLLP